MYHRRVSAPWKHTAPTTETTELGQVTSNTWCDQDDGDESVRRLGGLSLVVVDLTCDNGREYDPDVVEINYFRCLLRGRNCNDPNRVFSMCSCACESEAIEFVFVVRSVRDTTHDHPCSHETSHDCVAALVLGRSNLRTISVANTRILRPTSLIHARQLHPQILQSLVPSLSCRTPSIMNPSLLRRRSALLS